MACSDQSILGSLEGSTFEGEGKIVVVGKDVDKIVEEGIVMDIGVVGRVGRDYLLGLDKTNSNQELSH